MSQNILIQNWGISSSLIIEQAEEKWLKVKVISRNKNLFCVSDENKEVYFKSVDCWINSSFWLKAANDKELTYIIGEENDIKVPKSIYLNLWETINIDKVSEKLNFPIITKPIDGAHWDGVFLNIYTQEDLDAGVKYSFSYWASRIVLQEQIAGDDHRVIVVWNKVVAVTKRIPPEITWDGSTTIQGLINAENLSPDRVGEDHENKMSPIKIDDELENCLKEQWYSLSSILENKKTIRVRKNANLSSGWSAIDITDLIHNENKKQCVKLAHTLWLNMCWVDIFSTDISKTMEENQWAIIEVNWTPWIRMHHFPSLWSERNVAGEILDFIFQ